MSFNPSNPEMVGQEWPASEQRAELLSQTQGRGALITARTTETVDGVEVFLTPRAGSIVGAGQAHYALDFYPVGNPAPPALLSAYTVPSGFKSMDTGWSGTFGNVDEWPMTGSDVCTFTPAGTFSIFSGYTYGTIRFTGSAGGTWRDSNTYAPIVPANHRIVNIEIGGWFSVPMNPLGSSSSANLYAVVSFDGVTEYTLPGVMAYPIPGEPPIERYASMQGHVGPYRNYESFIPADADLLRTSTVAYWGVRAAVIPGNSAHIHALRARITYAAETRTAKSHAYQTRPPGEAVGQWVYFPFHDPATVSTAKTVTKTAGNRYLVVVRHPADQSGSNEWRSLDTTATHDPVPPALPDIGSTTVTLIAPGAAGVPAPGWAPTLPDNPAPSIVWRSGATVLPTDGQPYVAPHTFSISDPPPTDAADTIALSGGISISQTLTPPAGTYGLVQVGVLVDSFASLVTAPLIVQVLNDATSAVLGSSTIDATDLPPPTGRWHTLTARISPAIAITGTIRIRISSVTATTAPWKVLGWDTAARGVATFGGTASRTSVQYSQVAQHDLTEWDAATVIGQVPAPLLNFGIDPYVINTSHGLTSGCTVRAVEGARLFWDQPADFAKVGYYEVQRRDPDPAGWVTIARTYDPNRLAFVDVESHRNVEVSYRVRSVWLNGAVSDWTDHDPVVVQLPEWNLVLASNLDLHLTYGFMDEPGYLWTVVDAERTTTRYLYGVEPSGATGRERGIVLREVERRGDRFSRQVIVAFNDAAMQAQLTLSGRAVFDSLLECAHARHVPYLMLTDHRGRRWAVAPRVIELREDEPFGRYTATVEFTEISGPGPVTFDLTTGEGALVTDSGWDVGTWDDDVWQA